jgi:hemolysin-activating ACP:hemolysin acyltransferase
MGLFSNKYKSKMQNGSDHKNETVAANPPNRTEVPVPNEARPQQADTIGLRAGPSPSAVKFTAFGEILSLLGRQKPFADMPLGRCAALVGPAVDAGQFLIANAQRKDRSGPSIPVAVVLWARVSEEVDRKLSENLQEPVWLDPQEWTSGEIPWLILSVGPQQAVGTMLKTISQSFNPGRRLKARITDKDGVQRVGLVTIQENPVTP